MAGPARVVFSVWSALARAGACSHVQVQDAWLPYLFSDMSPRRRVAESSVFDRRQTIVFAKIAEKANPHAAD